MSPKDFSVGQVLHYYSPKNMGGSGQIEQMIVCRVGRKWVEASRNGKPGSWPCRRFAPPCLGADGGEYASPGEFILDVDEWCSNNTLNAEWNQIVRREIPELRPQHMTAELIAKLREILKGPTQ